MSHYYTNKDTGEFIPTVIGVRKKQNDFPECLIDVGGSRHWVSYREIYKQVLDFLWLENSFTYLTDLVIEYGQNHQFEGDIK